jgi:ribosomal protein S27AE
VMDGRVTPLKENCPNCGRQLVTKQRKRCVWCGAELALKPF